MSELKVGDRVEIKFTGIVESIEDGALEIEHESEVDGVWYAKAISPKHATKLAPKLEAGQTWLCEKSRKRKILAIHDYEIAYALEGCTGIHVQDEESFIEDVAHTLISEVGSE